MAGDSGERKGFSLRRWSARKHEAARADKSEPAAHATSPHDAAVDLPLHANRTPVATAAGSTAAAHGSRVPAAAPSGSAAPAAAEALGGMAPHAAPARQGAPADARVAPASSDHLLPELPSLDALTIDSDYRGFMQPGVDETLKRGALKKLFSDPRFNVMDGLDVYIDDYSKPDPIEPELVRKLVQARYIFNPPATRVNAAGFVEDVPDAEAPVTAADADHPDLADNDAATSAALPAGTNTAAATNAAPVGTNAAPATGTNAALAAMSTLPTPAADCASTAAAGVPAEPEFAAPAKPQKDAGIR